MRRRAKDQSFVCEIGKRLYRVRLNKQGIHGPRPSYGPCYFRLRCRFHLLVPRDTKPNN